MAKVQTRRSISCTAELHAALTALACNKSALVEDLVNDALDRIEWGTATVEQLIRPVPVSDATFMHVHGAARAERRPMALVFDDVLIEALDRAGAPQAVR